MANLSVVQDHRDGTQSAKRQAKPSRETDMDQAPNIEPGTKGRLRYDKVRRTIVGDRQSDAAILDRALGILHRMATEQTGWRRFLARWYYSDEPLRNDAANLVREARFGMPMPIGTRLLGDQDI